MARVVVDFPFQESLVLDSASDGVSELRDKHLHRLNLELKNASVIVDFIR